MRPVWSLLTLAMLLLAGCSGTSSSGEDEDDKAFEDLDVKASSGKGVIRGVVVDETITPLANATVQVQGKDLVTSTTGLGAFVFTDLEPGTYFLAVTKAGYDEVQVNAEVEAGVEKPPVLKVQLPRLPGSDPYYVPFPWDGFIGCSYRRPGVPMVLGGAGASCPEADTLWPKHDFLVDLELDRVPSWVVSEMQWKNTQTLGGEMSFNLRRTDTNQDTVDVEGTSPLSLVLTPEDIAYHEASDGDPMGGFGPDMPLRVIVFTAHLKETEPPYGGWGVGLQYEQGFSTFTHVFYNYQPPANWRFLDDATVPKPPE